VLVLGFCVFGVGVIQAFVRFACAKRLLWYLCSFWGFVGSVVYCMLGWLLLFAICLLVALERSGLVLLFMV